MKAIVQTRYGSPDVLQLRDVDEPAVGDDQVLVRVHAAAVNIGDWHLLRGVPYVIRLVAGLRRPRRAIPGLDIAGQVEAVGRSVRQFRPGDEVFGWCKGAFAECACAAESDLLPKPANLTSEQSAAVGDSAFTALAAVRDQGKVQPGERVLINGASGGVGTFAVQIAKSFGANVTGVCSTRNLDTVRSTAPAAAAARTAEPDAGRDPRRVARRLRQSDAAARPRACGSSAPSWFARAGSAATTARVLRFVLGGTRSAFALAVARAGQAAPRPVLARGVGGLDPDSPAMTP
jgi:NADPH:quinone reductase-like Zn-dependent oxidoreductase